MTSGQLSKYTQLYNADNFQNLYKKYSFAEYLDLCTENPKVLRNAFQYIYDMILADGVESGKRFRKTLFRYNFFLKHKTKVFGLEESLDALVNYLEGAAGHYGTQKRFLLLHGPVGSAKSTICRCIKEGLERYSQTDEGAWYSYVWKNLPEEVYAEASVVSPMYENPIKLLPAEILTPFLADLNDIHKKQCEEEKADKPKQDKKDKIPVKERHYYELRANGKLNPLCKFFYTELLKRYEGDWERVVENHIDVIRVKHSEADRVGIGTFQPKDEKNQDSTELTGDINFRNISLYGRDSDPRCFNFDGEFQVANRGMVEFIEALKLDTAFLYDLLEATQDHSIKPKKFSRINIDELIIGHTNNPEFEKLKNNVFMEAFKDRTVKIDIPYLLRVSDELKVLEEDYAADKVSQHIMPHTLYISAFFAVLTRLREDEKISLREKAKLYDGKSLPGLTVDGVKELRDKNPEEGLHFGVSARYIQSAISICIARNPSYVNVFHVLNELKAGLFTSSLIQAENREQYLKAWDLANKELNDVLKNEVQKALIGDEEAIIRLCTNYIDNLIAYVNEEKIHNPVTEKDQAPDERLMRSIEEKIGIVEQRANDYRRMIATSIGTQAQRGGEFRWDTNSELKRALELKLYDDTKDTIKLSSLSSEAAIIDPDMQEKIDSIKTRLIKHYGYNHQSATDVLEYVSSIFSGGEDDD